MDPNYDRNIEIETDSAMGVKVLGLNVRIGGRDVAITVEEARILLRNLQEVLHSPIDKEDDIWLFGNARMFGKICLNEILKENK